VWRLLEAVFRAAKGFPHDPRITEAEAESSVGGAEQAVMVALNAIGRWWAATYLKPQCLGLGAHVANAGYVVQALPGEGLGSLLCQHSLEAFPRLGSDPCSSNLV